MSEVKDIEAVAYKPSEIIGTVKAWLMKQNETAKMVLVEGVYKPKTDIARYAYCYDLLIDEASGEELTLVMPRNLRMDLVSGNCVTVGGFLDRSVQKGGQIQLQLKVTRIVGQQVAKVSEADAERMTILQEKRNRGFKNLDSILEHKLFNDERPKVALLLAASSITKSDFESAIHAARANVDFVESWSSFADKTELCQTLRLLDGSGYDAVAIVRGGGSGIDRLDEVEVLRTLCEMNTPIISAVGHVEERLAFKEIADKEVATPTGLGQYFSELCERVASEKAHSKAVLVKEVKKQFADQIKSLESRLTKQENDFKEERAGYIEREKRNVEEMANMKGKVAWMANKLNERKRTIIMLAIGLAVAVGLMVWIGMS